MDSHNPPAPAESLTRAPAMFRQIADYYEALMLGGQIAPGDKLPSAHQIAEIFGVGLVTADKSLRVLRERGLTETRGRLGSYRASRL